MKQMLRVHLIGVNEGSQVCVLAFQDFCCNWLSSLAKSFASPKHSIVLQVLQSHAYEKEMTDIRAGLLHATCMIQVHVTQRFWSKPCCAS
jgi:hypothetical protein